MFALAAALLIMMSMSAAPAAAVARNKVRLWTSETCPYAARAWIACNERLTNNDAVDFELRMVDLAEKPQDFNDMYASISPWGTATSSKVPILEDESNNLRLVESGVIAAYIEAKYPLLSSLPSPTPTPEQMAIDRLFVDTFEKTLGGLTMPILKAAGDEAACAKVVETVRTSIPIMESFFSKHCSSSSSSSNSNNKGPFVGGDTFSYAEMMCAPFIQRLLPVAKHFLNVDVLAMVEEAGATRLLQWIKATLERESVKSIQVGDAEIVQSYEKLKARFAEMASK